MANVADFEMFVIYENPRDFPDRYVVRRFVGTVPDALPLAVCETAEEARNALRPDLFNLGRTHADEPQILEVWI